MRNRVYAGSFLAVVSILMSASAAQHKDDLMIYPAADIKWMDAPPSLPKGAKMAILEGDPGKEGPFVFRVKLPDGYRVPPHTHAKTERITVISGTFNVGIGDVFDEKKTRPMPTGTYGHWPAGMKHFIWAKGETVLQFHGMGPWSIKYVNPDDDPRNQKKGAKDLSSAESRLLQKESARPRPIVILLRSRVSIAFDKAGSYDEISIREHDNA